MISPSTDLYFGKHEPILLWELGSRGELLSLSTARMSGGQAVGRRCSSALITWRWIAARDGLRMIVGPQDESLQLSFGEARVELFGSPWCTLFKKWAFMLPPGEIRCVVDRTRLL